MLVVVSFPALRRYRAERLLRSEFAGLRSKVLAIVRSRLQAKGITLDPLDLDACYSQAWHGLYAALLAGESIENPSGWLVLVTFRRAVDESRSSAHVRLASVAAQPIASNPDLAAELDDRARLRQVFEGFSSHLSPRERQAASLCYLHGLSRAEAAGRMGISEVRMRKLMDGVGANRPGVASKVSRLLETIESGAWCEQQSSLMRAFAFGMLDPAGERHALAVAHCRECPACRAHVAALRGLGAVLPLPLFSSAALLGGTAVGAGAGAGATRSRASALPRAMSHPAGGGVAGSLSAKLAVVAVVGLVGGYTALDRSNRHEGRRVERAGASSSNQSLSAAPTAGLAASRGHAPVPRRSVSTGSLTRPRATVATSHAHPASRTRSSNSDPSSEFGPERVESERATPERVVPERRAASTSAATSRASLTRTASSRGRSDGEFGL